MCEGCAFCRRDPSVDDVALTVRFSMSGTVELERLRVALGARSASEVMRRALCVLAREVDAAPD